MSADPAADPGPERERAQRHRALLWLCVAAVCGRWLLAARTPVPAEDGVNYLWMAQRFAAGDAAAALAEPFSPLWPLLLALPIACGAPAFLAGQVAGALVGGLGILPIAAIAERLRRGAGLPAAALATTSSVLARTAPEVLTEPLFVLVAGLGAWAGLAGRYCWLGVATGAAFLVRPEGAILMLPWLVLRPRAAWRALPFAAGLIAAFAAWRMACGHGFDPVPKMQFHELRQDLGGARGDLPANALQAPGVFLEAFAGAAVLAVLSLWPRRRVALRAPDPTARVAADDARRGERALWLLLGLGALVICTFVARRRFFVSWAPAVLPLAGVALARMQAIGARGRELLLALCCGLDLWTSFHGTIAADRLAERLVGEYLGARLAPGQTVVADMTRVLWFAGQRPLPPRHFDAAYYLEHAARPEVEFVVLHEESRRGIYGDVVRGLGAAFARFDLPGGLRDLADRRGIAVFVRR
ncbi:MAG: hypothetical protein AB7O97_06275 [Planctomycetota bacterium]